MIVHKKISILFLLITFLAIFLMIAEAKCPQSIINSRKKYREEETRYVVLLKPAASKKNKLLALQKHLKFMKECWGRDSSFVGRNFRYEGKSKKKLFVFSGDYIQGYSSLFDPIFVQEQLRKLPEIQFIERDSRVSTYGVIPDINEENFNHRDDDYVLKKSTTQIKPNSNLDRIDQAHLSLDNKYSFPSSAGSDVNIYVLDTGVNARHRELKGRVKFGGTFCAKCLYFDDSGHGTHVSALIAGKTFGVARKSSIIAIKVLDSSGLGYISEVIAGIVYVLKEHKADKNKNTIVNMSFGGKTSEILNYSVRILTKAGVHVVVAAGNDAGDACDVSPASESSVITVGAIESNENIKADFSNSGRCVDIFAPGVDIISASSISDTGRVIFSGTSQATPHITGTIALIIGEFGNMSPSKMAKRIMNTSTKNVISNLPYDTPNRLVLVPN